MADQPDERRGSATSALRQPRTDLFEIEVNGALVVHDSREQRVHLLNQSAAAVWRRLPGAGTVDDLTTAVADDFGVPATAIRADVEQALATLKEARLLQGRADDAGSPSSGVAPPSNTERPRPPAVDPDSRVARLGPYESLGYRFDIVGPSELVEGLGRTLASLSTEHDVGEPEHRYLISPGDTDGAPTDDAVLAWNGDLLTTGSKSSVQAFLLWHMNHEVCARSSPRLLLHASAIATGRGVIVFAGDPDTGKSTLVTALVRAGMPYVTDEVVPIDPTDLAAIAYPKPIGIDHGAWSLFPELQAVASPAAAQRWWVAAHDVRGAGLSRTVANGSRHRVRSVVFLGYDGSLPATSAHAIPPEVATVQLARNLFNLAEHGQAGLETIARLASTTPCYELAHRDLDSAIDWVRTTFP